jgi:hypothetical protein
LQWAGYPAPGQVLSGEGCPSKFELLPGYLLSEVEPEGVLVIDWGGAMWLINEDRKRAVNTESKIELRVEKVVSCVPVSDAGWWQVLWGDFVFATCEKEYDAIEAMIGLTLLTMDTVVAKTSAGMIFKKLNNISSQDNATFIPEAIKEIFDNRIKNNS